MNRWSEGRGMSSDQIVATIVIVMGAAVTVVRYRTQKIYRYSHIKVPLTTEGFMSEVRSWSVPTHGR